MVGLLELVAIETIRRLQREQIPDKRIAWRSVDWSSGVCESVSRERSRPFPRVVPANERWLPLFSISPRVTPRSTSSLIVSTPIPYRISNSASQKGAAQLCEAPNPSPVGRNVGCCTRLE